MHLDQVFDDGQAEAQAPLRARKALVGLPKPIEDEWKKLGPKEKQPYAIGLKGGGLMALAGLWENWKSPAWCARPA